MNATTADIVLAVHGGAGTPSRDELGAGRAQAARLALAEALQAGFDVLHNGGPAVEAVTAAIVVLEDSPLFNAGRGAALNAEGRAELDAAVMEGSTRRAGAVAGVHRVRNPIRLARAVMERSDHVLLIGEGAEAFARSIGAELVEPGWFVTAERQRDLERARARGATAPPHFGTVGAVARDRQGRLAAGTSTGGTTNKRYGRVGDSPIIGAGTWADERCAVSATGWGEFFIRAAVAHDVAARLTYRGDPLPVAARAALDTVGRLGGTGGLIALDAGGIVAMPFGTAAMYRGTVSSDGVIEVAIHDEPLHVVSPEADR